MTVIGINCPRCKKWLTEQFLQQEREEYCKIENVKHALDGVHGVKYTLADVFLCRVCKILIELPHGLRERSIISEWNEEYNMKSLRTLRGVRRVKKWS